MILSKQSLHCRLEWRPSRLLQLVLLVLMVLAVWSVMICALSWYLVIPVWLVIIYGTAFQIRKLRQTPHCSLFWRAGDDFVDLNFGHVRQSLTQPRCHRQGPLWIISGMDASRQNRYLVFLPDTLTRSERRLLRLVAATPLTLD